MTDYERVNQRGYLMKMTIPIFIELLLQMLVGNVDQIMVGRYSELSVGAIGNANQIMNLVLISFSVICTATTILVSLYMGSGNSEKVEQLYTLSIFINIIFSALISLVFFTLGREILIWLNVPDGLLAETESYIKIIGGGIFLQAIYLTFVAIFRSNTLMKESMAISVAVNAVNIAGNFILINGIGSIPAMGVAGAAVSSNISRFVGVIIIYAVFRKRIGAKIRLSHLRPFPWNLLKKLMSVGVPSGGENLSYNFSQIFIQRMTNYFGPAVIATRAYSCMFANISYVFAMAVGQACQILVGYLIGAGDTSSADKKVMSTTRLCIAISLSVSIVLYFCSDLLFGIFTDNPEVIALGRKIMLIEIALEIGRAVNIMLVRSSQAAGDVNFPIAISIIHVWLIAVGLGFVFSRVFNMGLVGIWIAMAMDECIRAVIFLFRWKSGRWKQKNLIAG